jgi:GNAT superfamily N-acetyltransferase
MVQLTSGVEIRNAGRSDVPSIVECLSRAFEPYRPEYTGEAFSDTVPEADAIHLRLETMHVLVAVSAGRIVGTVAGARNGNEGHLRGMAVLPEWIGRGVAARLLGGVEDSLRSRGCRRITLDTTYPLRAAIRFYEKNGYVRSGNVSDFFGMPLLEYVKEI